MGLYTQLRGPQNVIPKGNINLYDLAIQTGSTPEEASILSRNPDNKNFLEKKWIGQQLAEKGRVPPGGPQIGAPKESFDLGAGFQKTLSDLGRVKDIAFGNIPAPQQDVGLEQFKAAQAQNVPQPNREDILALVDRMREQEAGLRGAVPGGPGIPTPADTAPVRARALPGSAEITDPGEPDQKGMSPKTKAAILNIMSGLANAGKELTSVRTLADLRRGRGPIQPKYDTQLSDAADKILEEERVKEAKEEAKQKAIEEGKTNPIVKLAKEMGIEVQTEQDAIKAIQAKRTLASLGKTEAETAVLEGKAAESERQAQLVKEMESRRMEGDLSALSDDTKKELTKAEEALSKDKNYSKYIMQAQAATDIKSLLEQGGELAIRGMPVILARAMGEVGNLSQTEQDAYRKLLGLSGQIDSWREWWASTPSTKRIAAMQQLADEFERNAVPKVQDAINRRAGSFIRKYGNEATPEALMQHFTGFAMPSTVGAQAGTVTVKGADGKKYPGVSREDAEEGMRTGEILEIIE